MLRCSDCCHGSRSGRSPAEQRNLFTRRFLCNYQKSSTRTFEDAFCKLCEETFARAGFFPPESTTEHTNFRTRRPQTLQRNLCTRRFLCHAHKTQADTHARIKSITFFIAVRERMRAPRLHQGKLCLFGMYNTFVAVIRTSDQSVFIPAARGRMRIPLAPPGEGIQFLACVMHFYMFFPCRSEAHEDSLGSTRGKYTIFNMYNAFLMLRSL